jgi:hypothetical protein
MPSLQPSRWKRHDYIYRLGKQKRPKNDETIVLF